MKLINLTSHNITDSTTGKTYLVSGIVARAHVTKELVCASPLIQRYVHSNIDGLPEPKEGFMYIVSNMALNAVPEDRTDVVAPGPVEKNEFGIPVGCRGFRVK